MIHDNLLKDLVSLLLNLFGPERVKTILLNGSVLFNPRTGPLDLDIVLVLSSPHDQDYDRLRSLISATPSSLPLHLHLLYLTEVPLDTDLFSMHTCGPFILRHLGDAKVLYVENIFRTLRGPSKRQVLISLLQKVQECTFSMRADLATRRSLDDTDVSHAEKRLLRAVKALLMAHGVLLQHNEDLVTTVLRRVDTFSPAERKLLQGIADPSQGLLACREEWFRCCLRVHETIYRLLREHVSQELPTAYYDRSVTGDE
jgi:hypothetical protein